MMTKERIELIFVLLFRSFRQVRAQKLQKLAKYCSREGGERGGPILVK